MQKNTFIQLYILSLMGLYSISASANATDGLFGTYFDRMVGTGPCATAYVLTGFDATLGSFGTRTCKSVQELMREQYAGQVAPTGQAMLGFDSVGGIQFGDVNWVRNGTNVSYIGGRVGIGTSSPGASLDVTSDILINSLMIGRGGGNINTNTTVGISGLSANIAGAQNTAIGTNALRSNTMGYANTAIGTNALFNNTNASQNIAIGTNALFNNTAGNNNTVVGINALMNNTTGLMNVAIGENTLQPNTSGYQNTAVGVNALLSNTTGVRNTVVGMGAGTNITAGNDNVAIGAGAIVPGGAASNIIVIGAGAYLPNTNSNQIRLGNYGITAATINVAWTVSSDRKLKYDIEKIPLGLDFIRALHPVSYIRKNDEQKRTEFGFIAQDVEELLERYNIKNPGFIGTDTVDDIKSIRYNDFFAPIVQSIQELAVSLDTLTDTVRAQNSEIEILKNRLEALEKGSIQ